MTSDLHDRSSESPMPTAAEVDILAALWRLGPATVREVHEALGKDCGYNTTLTQMRLMTNKGLLRRSERFRNHVYEPAVPREQKQKRLPGYRGDGFCPRAAFGISVAGCSRGSARLLRFGV